MKNRTNVAPWIIFVALCAGAFFAPWLLPWAEAQRTGYVEKTASGAFANQLAPNPAEGLVLTPVGTDTSKVQWGTSGSSLPPGTPGQVPTVSATTATGNVIATGTQTAITTGTATHTVTASQTAQIGTATIVVTFTQGATQTTTGTGTGSYSYTSTGTVTTTGTEYTTKNGTVDFDPMGTFYFVSCYPGECAPVIPWRLGNLSSVIEYAFSQATVDFTATCSTGSDVMLNLAGFPEAWTMTPWDEAKRETGYLWPGGAWLARLKAKVNANGAAIRVQVYEVESAYPHTEHEWFNFTTDVFTNTEFATIEKMTTQAQRIPSSPSNYIGFRFYATCSSSTTVTLQFNDEPMTTRLESPIVVDQLYVSDIWGLDAAISTIEGDIADREPIISGTPGQFVKFIGTGTSATTSKGGVTVSIPTPITTRTITIPAGDFKIGVGAAASNVSSILYSWTLRDGQVDQVYGAILGVPADYASGMAVSVVWSPSATDSNSAHRVSWSLSTQSLTNGNPTFSGGASWDGTTCSSNCTANYLIRETTTQSLTVTAGTRYALYFSRNHISGSDTYVGDARLVALIFSYTSSL